MVSNIIASYSIIYELLNDTKLYQFYLYKINHRSGTRKIPWAICEVKHGQLLVGYIFFKWKDLKLKDVKSFGKIGFARNSTRRVWCNKCVIFHILSIHKIINQIVKRHWVTFKYFVIELCNFGAGFGP